MTGYFVRSMVTAAMLVSAVPALAEATFWSAQVKVDYSGLNLASPSGRQAFDHRIDAAIRTMCGAPVFGTRDEAEALQACHVEARTAAEPQVKAVLARANMTMASRN
nr:UrcA family protein [Polymorphobacter sp.]